jgi:chemotaxis family two-component system response regulator PixG
MNARPTSDNLIIREFTALKQIKLFSSLKEAQVTGQLTFTDPIKRIEWHLYLDLGEIVYGTGGVHPVRRWQRNLISNLPQIPFQLSNLQEELTERKADLSDNVWEYEQISYWVEQQIITSLQGTNAVFFTLEEILFDLTQTGQVICRLNRDKIVSPNLEPVEPEDLIERVNQIWSSWKDAKVVDKMPNTAPIILQPQQLQKKTSISAYQSLCKLLNGNRTLRDLSVQLRTSSLQVVNSLLPYIQSGIFGLVDVPDLLELNDSFDEGYSNRDRPLIACVDDSLMVSHMMEQIISMAGYRFMAINDPENAITSLISRQPDLIFLDVVMPNLSGYDLCAQLRKHPEFAETPVIFLTSNSGLIDRIRAKMVGSSDFLKKTVDADELLQKIVQHLS